MQQESDVKRAKETVDTYKKQLEELNAQFEDEQDLVGGKLDAMTEELEVVTLRPKKTDATVTITAKVRGYTGASPAGYRLEAMLHAALGTLASADLRGDVARIAIPTLVVAGERDTLAPPEASAWLAQALPAAQLLRLPGAGHAPFLSHPEAFRDALLGFLADE